MALLYASWMSPLTNAWPTSACWMPQAPKPLFWSTASLTCFLHIFVSFLRWHLCTPMWYTVRALDSLQYSAILHAPHHFLLAIFPLLKHTLCPLTFWKFVMFDFPSAECLNKQLVAMQYGLQRHLPTFLVPISSFLLDVFILKYLRSWLFCIHSCGEHFILYSLKPFMSCGSSSMHSASILRNKCIGNCNSLSLVLLWSESDCSEVVTSESSVRSITSSASSRHISYSRVLGQALSMVTSSSVCLSVGSSMSNMAS